MSFAKFMASTRGRILRIAAGAGLIYLGYFEMSGAGGYALALVGLAPLLAGIFDFCIFAPLFGAPFSGKAIRKA